MLNNSYEKMLGRMAGKSKTKPNSAIAEQSEPQNEYQTSPTLTPGSEMENALTAILGANAAKTSSPMDQ